MVAETTSRGARSASGWAPAMIRRPDAVDEHGALAAHRLGDQRLLARGARAGPEHGRVELHHLDVGDLGAGPQRERQPVAGGAGRGRTAPRTPGRSRRWRARRRARAGRRRRPARRRPPMRATRRPTTRPSAVRSASSATVCSSTSMPRARSAPASVRVTSAPLASPPACTIRSRLCPPSRVSAGRPSDVEVQPGAELPAARRSAAGASSTRVRTAASSQRPAPATSVSCDVQLGVVVGTEDGGQPALGPGGAAVAERALGDDGDRAAGVGQRDRRHQARPRRCRRRRRRSLRHPARRGQRAGPAPAGAVAPHSPTGDGVPMATIASTAARARAAIAGSTVTSSRPSRSARSSFSGVDIFM